MVSLSARQRLTYTVHLFKALTKKHHADLVPFLQQHIKPDAVILDIGANAGNFTRIFSKLAPQGTVHAFEPGSYALSILKRVIAVRGLKNVKLHTVGLSDKKMTLDLHMPVKQSGSVGFGLAHIGDDKAVDPRATVSEQIPLDRLDDVAKATKIERVDFIKIDVEGWELRALTGGEELIARNHPVIMLEMVDRFLQRAGDSSAALFKFLYGHGYDIYRFDETGRTDFLEAPVVDGDIICIPQKV
jgi:FkbM family methyltransferase